MFHFRTVQFTNLPISSFHNHNNSKGISVSNCLVYSDKSRKIIVKKKKANCYNRGKVLVLWHLTMWKSDISVRCKRQTKNCTRNAFHVTCHQMSKRPTFLFCFSVLDFQKQQKRRGLFITLTVLYSILLFL